MTGAGDSIDPEPGGDVIAVIVNYNAGALLAETVDALLAGSVRPRVVVVDNASTDHSIEVLRAGPNRRAAVSVTLNPSNLGFARANNPVLRAGGAAYFLLLNPDCVPDTDALERLLACMTWHPEVGLAGAALRNPDGSLQKTSKRRLPTPWSALARTLGLHRMGTGGGVTADFDLARDDQAGGDMESVEAVSGALMLVRAAALREVGLLDEGYFMHCEDLDWCKRFRDAGYRVAYVPDAGAVHHKGGSGRGPRVVWHLHRSMLRFYDKHYRSQYPWLFSALVRAGVYARCGVAMLVSLVRPRH